MIRNSGCGRVWRNTRRSLSATVAMGGLLTLTACAVGPDYARPQVDVGSAYKAAMAPELQSRNQGWELVQASQSSTPAQWWTLFNEPVLSALMEDLNTENLDIAQAEARYRQAQAALQSSRAGFYPTLNAASSFDHSSQGGGSGGEQALSGRNQYSLSGTVAWEADIWGRVRRSVESSEAGLQASQADVAAMRLSMQSTLAQTYFQLRAREAESLLLQQTVEAYERSVQTVLNRFQVGIAAQSDVATARVQLENARVQHQAQQRQRTQLLNALAVLVGKTPAQFSLNESSMLAAAPVVPVDVPSRLLQRRPDIIAAERRAAQANASIGVAQAAWFPTLTLSAQGGYRSGEWARWLSAPASFWSLGPALALAIFDGGARQAQLDQARASYDLQALAYRQQVLVAMREVEDYLVQTQSLVREQTLQDRALQAAIESLQLTRNQYDAGLIDYLSVVQVETAALAAQRSALSLQSERLTSAVQLIAALGGGWTEGDGPTAD
jgi:NodT family efflux transporter outer membrane factor (OMF) lipoprotein